MSAPDAAKIELVPIDRITVVNPRARNKKIFKEIVQNIATVGLKRPITVAARTTPEGVRYDLVCGQGRLEAFQSLGQTEIPAIVVNAGNEDCLVMSLVENLARRQHRSVDLLRDIGRLSDRGYDEAAIAEKTGLTPGYVKAIIHLLDTGEHRLLTAVDAGQLPVSVAVDIAKAKDGEVRRILQDAYEKKLLRGQKLLAVKRLVEQRKRSGKGRTPEQPRDRKPLSVERLLRTFQDDIDKKRQLIRKAERTRDCLVFVVESLRTLLADENFVTLLRAEDLQTAPRNISDRMEGRAPP